MNTTALLEPKNGGKEGERTQTLFSNTGEGEGEEEDSLLILSKKDTPAVKVAKSALFGDDEEDTILSSKSSAKKSAKSGGALFGMF